MTLKPRSAAAPAVCSTEVCACVPVATTVLMPLFLSVFSRSLPMNLSGPIAPRMVSPAAGVSSLSILKELTPAAGETILGAIGPDKFIGSDLEKTLKNKGIKTVVATGTQAQTSVLHTAGAAALRGFKVIVPVDGMSSDDAFPELYTAWHLATAARISNETTLTKFDLISF